MTKVQVHAGACGFSTVIEVQAGKKEANFHIETQCPSVQKLAAELTQGETFKIAFTKILDNPVFILAGRHLKHPGCPVPAAIIKATEVAAGLAVPKNAEIIFSQK
ncbi:DUF6951 family protein [Calderihabitans maritimus]|uniref:Uncharacterized protein n=1 Tax=Calderihabitans maritimus TaxID=1246530 RepID=A0A1Z5HW89_9FIRM|nr:hypothetical protein [Calderihabitans maritimus]GAW93678.1 hypothetical protein DEHRE_04370 [Calderihabitans maritimus]